MSFSLERERPESCLSDLRLDRLVAGEVAPDHDVSAHLRSCDACRARLALLRREFAAFDVAPPRSQSPRRWLRAASLAATAVAAAAALLLVIGRPAPAPRGRLKGGVVLELIARRASGAVEQLLPGATLAPGDAIRFRVSSDRAGYLAIIGIDAARAVTPYAPAEGAARPLGPARDTIVDGSIILDETLGPERIVALVCPRPVAVSAVVAAGKRALAEAHDDPVALGPLPLECAEASRLIIKRPAP